MTGTQERELEDPLVAAAVPPPRRPVRNVVLGFFPRAMACTAREAAVAVGLSVGLTAGWLAIMFVLDRSGIVPLVDYRTSGGDTKTYLAMAEDPKGVHWAPLAFRGLEPWLAHSLSVHHYWIAFQLLTWSALAAGGPAVYLICRRLGGAHPAALVGMAGLMCLPMWLFFIHQPYLVDAPAMALLAWCMVALVNGWLALLPLLLVVTGLARETVVGLAVPIYMWLRQKWVDLHTAWQVLLMMAPAAVTIWAIRQPMEHTGPEVTRVLMQYGLNYVQRDVLPKPHWWIFYGIAGSLGIWWLLGLYGRKWGGRLWWMLIPVFAQWLFGSDYARYALYAYPVVVACGAIALWTHPRRALLLGLVAAQSLAVVADFVFVGNMLIYRLQPSTWVGGGLMVATAVVLWWDSGLLRRLTGRSQQLEAVG
jgi:hypothetical protein